MKLFQLTCKNCGAQLNIDLDNLQAYCPFCGQKLMFKFKQMGKVFIEREKTRRATELKDKSHSQERYRMDFETKERQKDWKRKAIKAVAIALVCFFVFYCIPKQIFGVHKDKVAYLQQLEVEIEIAIKEEDYDTALFKANQLYCDDNWSSEQTKAWDAKRKAYIEIVKEKKRESDIKNPNNIFMPTSSNSLKGKKYKDVVDQLSVLGFTNITLQRSSEETGLFNKVDTVEHILVGGKTNFSTKDYFNKDTKIIIYYYSK